MWSSGSRRLWLPCHVGGEDRAVPSNNQSQGRGPGCPGLRGVPKSTSRRAGPDPLSPRGSFPLLPSCSSGLRLGLYSLTLTLLSPLVGFQAAAVLLVASVLFYKPDLCCSWVVAGAVLACVGRHIGGTPVDLGTSGLCVCGGGR